MKRRAALALLAFMAISLLVPELGHGAKCSDTPSGTGTSLPSLDGQTNVVVNHWTYVGGQGSASSQSGALYGNVGTTNSVAGFYFGGSRSAPTAAQGCVQAGTVCLAYPDPTTQCAHS